MSATKGSKPEDTDSSNTVLNTHDDENVSSSGSQEDIGCASAQAKPKGESAENEKCATCKKRRRQTRGMEKEIRK